MTTFTANGATVTLGSTNEMIELARNLDKESDYWMVVEFYNGEGALIAGQIPSVSGFSVRHTGLTVIAHKDAFKNATF